MENKIEDKSAKSIRMSDETKEKFAKIAKDTETSFLREVEMNNSKQNKIFGKNLSNYVRLSDKEQKDIAKELGYPATTFNTWCMGKVIPSMEKVQHIADYFRIGKFDLLDDKSSENKYSNENEVFIPKIQEDEQVMKMLKYFTRLSNKEKDTIEELMRILCDKKAD